MKGELIVCKHCGRPEWWGRMIWLSGRCMCRKCYKEDYERTHGKPYTWDDLDGDEVPETEKEDEHGQADAEP